MLMQLNLAVPLAGAIRNLQDQLRLELCLPKHTMCAEEVFICHVSYLEPAATTATEPYIETLAQILCRSIYGTLPHVRPLAFAPICISDDAAAAAWYFRRIALYFSETPSMLVHVDGSSFDLKFWCRFVAATGLGHQSVSTFQC